MPSCRQSITVPAACQAQLCCKSGLDTGRNLAYSANMNAQEDGFVYGWRIPFPEELSRYIKIGWTTNMQGRMRAFGLYLPVEPRLVFVRKVDRPSNIEMRMKRILAVYKWKHEWFAVSDEIVLGAFDATLRARETEKPGYFRSGNWKSRTKG